MKTIAYCVLWALAIFMVAGGSATAQDLAKIVTKADVEKVTGAKFKDGWKPMPTQMSFGQEGGDLQISVDVEPREVSSTVRGWEATIKKMQPSNSVETVPGVGKDAIYYSMRPDTAQFPPTSTVRACNCASRSRAPRPPRKRSRSSSISRRSSGRASASSFPLRRGAGRRRRMRSPSGPILSSARRPLAQRLGLSMSRDARFAGANGRIGSVASVRSAILFLASGFVESLLFSTFLIVA